MGVERIDYSSDADYEQARDMESYEAQQWDDRRQAEEAEQQMIEEELQKESVPAETLVMLKIAEMINEIQAEHFGIMKKFEKITTSDKRTTSWYESAAVIRELENLKQKIKDNNFSE